MSAQAVLLTRPLEDSREWAALLEEKGCVPLIEPLLEIVPKDAAVKLPEQYRGLIFTSANGVRVFAAHNKIRDLPVYAVGKNTAAAAREAGFLIVASADGGVKDLAELLKMQKPGAEPFLHVRGEDISESLKDLLSPQGLKVTEQVVYKAEAAKRLSSKILEKLEGGEIDAALFFSARTARIFTDLLEQAGLERTVEDIKALSISDGVLECLSVLPWNSTYVAATPDRGGMLEALSRVLEERDTEMQSNTRRKTMNANDDQALENAEQIIERFGGIRPMASKINVPVTTVQGWKKRNVIPGPRREEILAAAQSHNIDLSDIAADAPAEKTSPIANENNKKPESFAAEVKKADAPKQKSEGADLGAPDAPPKRHEELMAAIEEGDRKTVQASIWTATALVGVTVAAAIVLLWPSKQKIDQHDGQIAVLETEVKDVNQRAAFLRDMVPEDIQQKFSDLQQQARTVQEDVRQIGQKAEEIREGVLGAEAGSLSDRVSVLEQQFAEIEGLKNLTVRIRELEQSIAGQEQLNASIGELRTIVDGLEGRMGDFDQKLSEAQSGDGALGETLEGVTGNDLKAAAMLIAFSQLRDSLNREAPFEDDLALLEKMVGSDNEELNVALTRLAPHADGGVLTPSRLSGEFKGLAGDIVVSSLKGEDVSIMDKAKARLNDVLKVEKEGELVTGTDTQAKVARAQLMLDHGDVQGAIAELQSLEGEAAQTAQPFIEQAQATALAQQVQAMLQQTILSKVGGGLPIAGGAININQIQQELQGVVEPQEVIRDPESGTVILPRQQGFKGFSAGQP